MKATFRQTGHHLLRLMSAPDKPSVSTRHSDSIATRDFFTAITIWAHSHRRAVANYQMTTKSLMKIQKPDGEAGAMGYVLMWLLGIPIPILLLFFLLRGCT
ncbi:MAG: hypothetical protein M3Y03_06240 [Verrucomicrobiota bacterium]|nr:hypothetical protein [Verrucomicrobiota bacterium]